MDTESDRSGKTGGTTAESGRGDRRGGPSATVAVVDAVAAATDRDPIELPPLYEWIDPDALDALFASRDDRAAGCELRVEFAYAGFEVVVRDGPQVTVRER